MKNQNWMVVAKILVLGVATLGLIAPAYPADCLSAREYITTLEYLRANKDLALPETEAQKLSRQVAEGCTGAAMRFIRVSSALSKAGLGSKDSTSKGLEFARRSDREADTFSSVFRKAFFADGLDLDLYSSIRMADQLTTEFEGDTYAVRDDFERLLSFCAEKGKLDLPRPQCGAYAARLARLGQKWSGGVAMPFMSAFEFLRSQNGPSLPTGRSLEIAEKLISHGPDGPDNFITAYKYAISKKGLGLADAAAISFAMDLGLESKPASK